MSLEIVVLAAGQGKRMRSELPKVLQPIGGRPMLAHVFDAIEALSPTAVHVVYGHGGDAVRAAFSDRNLNWCLQAEQLGTGHAVLQAMPHIKDGSRVLILCGDVPLVDAKALQALLDDTDAPLAILSARLPNPTGYGRILRSADGSVRGIVEEKDASDAQRRIEEVNTGIMIVDSSKLRDWLSRLGTDNSQGEYYLTDIVGQAISDDIPVNAIESAASEGLLGINDKLQLAATERHYQLRAATQLMQQGATLADPSRIDVRGQVKVGGDVFIDVGCVFEGDVSLGDGASIGPYCVIRNSSIGAGTTIEPHSVIDEAMIASDCNIGPFARIRPGANLADHVKVGNFVEIKNSHIAVGSKVNHLTYIGDAEIGAGVNVGAGTVTCNYDGANKYKTVISANAFIGSGVMLVAPVRVGEGATIGAGSTITKDTPDEKLTVARAKQVSVDGWKRPVKKPK